jgi:hypothetical protein
MPYRDGYVETPWMLVKCREGGATSWTLRVQGYVGCMNRDILFGIYQLVHFPRQVKRGSYSTL